MQVSELNEWSAPIPAQAGDGKKEINEITKLLESSIHLFGYSYYDTFTQTIDLMHHALNHNEAEYMKMVKSMKPEGVNLVKQVIQILIKALYVEYQFDDYLGSVYERLSHNNKQMGQYFTPWHVAYMIAKITLGDVKEQIEKAKLEKTKITINEPSVGSGVMLLAIKRVIMEEAGLAGLDYFEFSGMDKDPLCVKMCQIHMMLTDYHYMASRMIVAAHEALAQSKQSSAPVTCEGMKNGS